MWDRNTLRNSFRKIHKGTRAQLSGTRCNTTEPHPPSSTKTQREQREQKDRSFWNVRSWSTGEGLSFKLSTRFYSCFHSPAVTWECRTDRLVYWEGCMCTQNLVLHTKHSQREEPLINREVSGEEMQTCTAPSGASHVGWKPSSQTAHLPQGKHVFMAHNDWAHLGLKYTTIIFAFLVSEQCCVWHKETFSI